MEKQFEENPAEQVVNTFTSSYLNKKTSLIAHTFKRIGKFDS